MTPERVIEVAIGLHDGPRTGAEAPPTMAKAVLAALAEHGLVAVRAEDIRAVLGPNPGLMPYVEAGRRLLAAIDDKETCTHA